MRELTKENIKEFNELYHNFHDSYIYNISYDINKSQIELLIDVQWKGEPILKEDGKYNTNYGTGNQRRSSAMDNKKICVKQYDLEGNFIKEYPSMKEAERQTGISTGSISKVCSQQRKSAGGYIWTKEM